MKGLGQVLKSFRDRSADFPVYDRNSGSDDFLQSLGPLEMPTQGSRTGLEKGDPRSAIEAHTEPSESDNVASINGRIASG
jgi:hypothetical protein